MRQCFFTPRRWVVDAQRHGTLIDAIKAIVRTHTGANVVLTLFDDLPHDVWISHVCAGHADHVDFPGFHSIARSGNILNARGVEYRETRCSPHVASTVQVRRTGHAHDRNIIREAGIRLNVAARNVQEIDKATVLQRL